MNWAERDAAVQHFNERGWVVLDILPVSTRALLTAWADEVAALPESTGVLQHREQTDTGPQLCRSEHFLDVHPGFRDTLTRGALPDAASALLGERSVLYKEKINHKLPGGAGYSPHQDAPAYPMVSAHVSAMVAIDPADDDNGGLEVVTGCFDRILPTDDRGCIEPATVARLAWEPVAVPAGSTLWFHSRTPHRSGPNRSDRPRRALYPTYNAAREGDRRAEYYAAKAEAFSSAGTSDRARVSLIGDFEGEAGVKVVFTVLDSLPVRHVGERHTPVLTELAHAAGAAPGQARAVMTAATYPNHASFATGARPSEHGIGTNYVPHTGGFTPAWELGPAVPTLFDACRAVGRSSAAVVGDQCLIGVMGARAADTHWPPDGEIPPDARRDAHDYIDDADTIGHLLGAVDARPDLVVSQLNAPDTAAHVHGPDSDAALAAYRETDARLALVRDRLDWADTVWIVVSDHDQETVVDREPVDLRPAFARRGLDLFALPEGSATVVCGDGAAAAARWLPTVEGVEGAAPYHLADPALEACLAWCVPGRTFGFAELPTEPGTHGGPRTRAQVAVVSGGHALAPVVARAAAARPVSAIDWAPTIATLLGLALPHARGRSLV